MTDAYWFPSCTTGLLSYRKETGLELADAHEGLAGKRTFGLPAPDWRRRPRPTPASRERLGAVRSKAKSLHGGARPGQPGHDAATRRRPGRQPDPHRSRRRRSARDWRPPSPEAPTFFPLFRSRLMEAMGARSVCSTAHTSTSAGSDRPTRRVRWCPGARVVEVRPGPNRL